MLVNTDTPPIREGRMFPDPSDRDKGEKIRDLEALKPYTGEHDGEA